MDKTKHGIYKIEHTASGKLYVGSAMKIARRWIEHVRDLRAGNHSSRKMQRAWNKYGADAFVFSILENVENPDELLGREQYWLDLTMAVKKGYNNAPTAGSNYGFRHAAATKVKMSAAHVGLVRSEEHRRNLSIVNTGKVMSDEARQKMRNAKLGKKRPSHSPETRALMSEKAMGRTFSSETRAKMALAKLGGVLSVEVRAKMSIAQKSRRSSS